jgi:hypothetical protein
MLKLRARRGAIAILTVLLFLALLGVGAVVVDFARVELIRNQLQTAADAAALAGAVQLTTTNKNDYLLKAKSVGQANPLFDSTVAVPDEAVEVGRWDPATRTFSATGSPSTADAVRVTLHHPSSYLIGSAIGFAPKQIGAQAVAWAGPSVGETSCMKPWALWMGQLMTRINMYRFGSPGDPLRPMEPEDLDALREMPETGPTGRTFTVFLGNSSPDSTFQGNFYAVSLPPFYHADGSPVDTIGNGANNYEQNISGARCNSVSVGDSLLTEPGAMVGKTCAGVVGSESCNVNGDGICATLVDNMCKGPNGEDVVVKTAFWDAPTSANGRLAAVVKLVGSFQLKTFTKQNGKDGKAVLTGTFLPLADPGPIGGQTTTLVRIILVQ